MNQKQLSKAISYFKQKGIVSPEQPDTEETWQWIAAGEYLNCQLRLYFEANLSDETEIDLIHSVREERNGFVIETPENPNIDKLQEMLESMNAQPSTVHIKFSSPHLQVVYLVKRFKKNGHHLNTMFECSISEHGPGFVEFLYMPKTYDVDVLPVWVQHLRTFSALSNEHTTADRGLEFLLNK